jgi:tRNA 2-thiocytidine biosynthesis protein TtcA
MLNEVFFKEIEKVLKLESFIPAEEPVDDSETNPQFRLEKLEKRIKHLTGRAVMDFSLIEEGDRIMVAISGGKDSWALLHVLNELRKRAPIDFSLVAVNIDQGYRGFRQDVVEDFVEGQGYEYHMEVYDIASIVEEKVEAGGTPCSLCARLRRGALYGYAEKYNCNKIALGHHLDDMIETLLLNQFFVGKLASMAPKLQADDGKNIVIRPLIYVTEKDIIEFVGLKKFPIVCCQCPLMCGETVHGDFKRRMVKQLIQTLEKKIPNIKQSLLTSMTNVSRTHLLDRDQK